MHTWRFYADFLASFPFELIFSAFSEGGESDSSLRIVNLLKVLRLLRLARIISYLNVNKGAKLYIKLFQAIFSLLLIGHWAGCGWVLLARNTKWIAPHHLDDGDPKYHDFVIAH